jgi:hypothetical protein
MEKALFKAAVTDDLQLSLQARSVSLSPLRYGSGDH